MNEEIERKVIRQKIRNFCNERKNYIVTTRFNNKTFQENTYYIEGKTININAFIVPLNLLRKKYRMILFYL